MYRKLSNNCFCLYNTSSNSTIDERYNLSWGKMFSPSFRNRCELTSRELSKRETVVEYLCPAPRSWNTTPDDITILFINRLSLESVRKLGRTIEKITSNKENNCKTYIEGKKILLGYNKNYERVCPVCYNIMWMEEPKAKLMNTRTVIHLDCVKKFKDIICESLDEKYDNFIVSGKI